jgi:hypothetical protein
LAKLSDGDARKALNALEIAALTTAPDSDGVIHLDLTVAEQSIQKKAVVYDDEDAHYDTISAFIKSMRGSDPDATLYWLAKMIHAGEDPRFIARRIVIHAAEDVGLADPMALVLANAAFQAAEFIGWPEARIPLAEAAIYIATATKSNSTVLAIDAALKDVESGRTLAVPEHLRDASYRGAKRLGHGQGYQYAHDHPEHFVAQDYLGADKRYYEPTEQGVEKKIKERVEKWRAQFAKAAASVRRPKDDLRQQRSCRQADAEQIREAKQALRNQVGAELKQMEPGEQAAASAQARALLASASAVASGAVGLVLCAVAGGTGYLAAADARHCPPASGLPCPVLWRRPEATRPARFSIPESDLQSRALWHSRAKPAAAPTPVASRGSDPGPRAGL